MVQLLLLDLITHVFDLHFLLVNLFGLLIEFNLSSSLC